MNIGAIKPTDPSARDKFIQVFFNSANEEEAIFKTASNANINLTDKTTEWLTTLHRWIRNNNPIYMAYQQANDYLGDDDNVNIIFTKHVPVTAEGDPRTYSDPNEDSGVIRLNNELGMIIDTTRAECGTKYDHDIVVKKRGQGLSSIRSDHRLKEPLLYPLLFPYGTPGYGYGIYFHERVSERQDGTDHGKRTSEISIVQTSYGGARHAFTSRKIDSGMDFVFISVGRTTKVGLHSKSPETVES